LPPIAQIKDSGLVQVGSYAGVHSGTAVPANVAREKAVCGNQDEPPGISGPEGGSIKRFADFVQMPAHLVHGHGDITGNDGFGDIAMRLVRVVDHLFRDALGRMR